jgi:Myb DNA-binding like
LHVATTSTKKPTLQCTVMSPPTAASTSTDSSIGISLTSVKPAGKKKRKTTFRPANNKAPAKKKKLAPPSLSSTSSSVGDSNSKAAQVPEPKLQPPPPPPPPLQRTTVEGTASSGSQEKTTGEEEEEVSPVTNNTKNDQKPAATALESAGETSTTKTRATATIQPAPVFVAENSTKKAAADDEAPIKNSAAIAAADEPSPSAAPAPALAAAALPTTTTTKPAPAPAAAAAIAAAAATAKRGGPKRKKAGVAIRTSSRSRAIVVAVSADASRFSSRNQHDASDTKNHLDENNHHQAALMVRNKAGEQAVGLSNTLADIEDAAAGGGGALTRTALPAADSSQSIPESNGPLLSSFCSKFPRKKRAPRVKKGDAKNATNNAATGAPAAAAAAAASSPLQDATAAAAAAAAAAGPVVQIVNGEIVLQEDSMVLNANATTKAIDEEYTVVEEEAQLAVIGASYNSFIPNGKRSTPKRWSAAETELFYEALRQVGADFGTMEAYFASTTQRTRKQLKSKYLKEMAHVPHLIEAALHPQLKKAVDLTVFDVTITARPVLPPEAAAPTAAPSAENENDANETLETAKNDSTTANSGDENEILVQGEEEAQPATRSRQKGMLRVLPPLPSSSATASKNTGLDNDDEYDNDDISKSAGPSLWPDEEEERQEEDGDDHGRVDIANNDDDDIVHHDDDPSYFPDEQDHDVMDRGGDCSKQIQQQKQQQQQVEELTTIALVSTAFSKKKTSKKPKFRSRKKAAVNK